MIKRSPKEFIQSYKSPEFINGQNKFTAWIDGMIRANKIELNKQPPSEWTIEELENSLFNFQLHHIIDKLSGNRDKEAIEFIINYLEELILHAKSLGLKKVKVLNL